MSQTDAMSTEHVEALRKLTAEVGGLKAFEPGVREAIGNTHWTVLMQRLDEAEAALSRTAQAPVADGVREARRQAIEEVLGLLTGHELYRYRPKAFNGFIEYARATLASSDPTPATEAGGDEVAAQRLAASPLPSSSETEWRPIETAPHGVEVLLATPPFRCMGEQARWEMRVGCASWGERIGGFSNRSQDAYATHWMPLPSAPVSHGGAE